jgi:nicotinate-nucleotide adenylyltransferase
MMAGLKSARVKLPSFGANQRIGLFGGSFNPAHEGHVHVALTAVEALALDWLWVLVTPGNPLKKTPDLSLAERMARLRKLMRHPKIVISDIEAKANLRFSLQTIQFLKARAPNVHFVWVMGADNLASFDRWQGWEEIINLIPLAVVDREEGRFAALNSKAAKRLAKARLDAEKAALLPLAPPPAWVFLHGKHVRASSTALRKAGRY